MNLEFKDFVEQSLTDWIETLDLVSTHQSDHPQGLSQLKKSISYSLKQTGKRFRPVLCLMISDCFGVAPQRVVPFACALEMIHTYSLIHDDLPSMDNDDFRRGQLTNHKVFGEATALLAGDVLLTQAFFHLAKFYQNEPSLGLKLVSLLAEASGFNGMAGGQALDLAPDKGKVSADAIQTIHILKTGALIRVACEGAGLICGLPEEKIKRLRAFGEKLGLSFQIKDDLLDEDKIGENSFLRVLSKSETLALLDQTTSICREILSGLGIPEGSLSNLIDFNFQRSV